MQTATRAKRIDQRAKAVTMRIAGYSPEEIAEELGYTTTRAVSDDIYGVMVASLTLPDRQIDILREIEIRRMDMMLKALMPGIERGNTRSVEVGIRLLERRAKMLGLDSATKVEVFTIDTIDAQIAKLTEELAARMGQPAS